MNDFVAKPIELSEMSRVLKRWLPKEMIREAEGEQKQADERKKCFIPELDMEEGIKNCGSE